MILIDTTPALLTADPAIISRVVDGVVMVVKPAKNHRRQVTRMVERYTMLKLPVLGLIVNAYRFRNRRRLLQLPQLLRRRLWILYGEDDDNQSNDEVASVAACRRKQ